MSAEGLEDSEGWWNSISGGDFDNDGDIDYVAGNLGLNTKYSASKEQPLRIYASDYDNNGRLDPVLCYYINGENHIAHTRDEIIKQISAMRARFKTYQEYGEATFDQSFLSSELQSAHIVRSKRFESTYIENKGDGAFVMHSLPMEAQMAPTYGLAVNDYDRDGKLDVLLTGNSYATEVSTGRYDSSFGLLLLGKGDGKWQPLDLRDSGIRNRGDAKGMVSLNYRGRNMIIVANNDAGINSYITTKQMPVYQILPEDNHAKIYYSDGSYRRIEFYNGSGYISQSSKSFSVDGNVVKITITDSSGQSRELKH
jgi:hypothetical protein